VQVINEINATTKRFTVLDIAPDVTGAVVERPVRDNQPVKKGDLLMQIDPSYYQIAVEPAQAAVAARNPELRMRRDDAQRRANMDNLVVSKENCDNATLSATSAEAQYQQAQAEPDAAKLNLAHAGGVAGGRVCDQSKCVPRRLCDCGRQRSWRSSIATRSGYMGIWVFRGNQAAARQDWRQGRDAPEEW
jgi:multidrug efflux pump subunit AcrA (membrane-fusion protein)